VAVFDSRPSRVVDSLPRVLADPNASFMVILAGAMTSAQELAARRAHRVRGDRVRALYEFFGANNTLYTGVPLDGARVDRLDDDTSHVVRDVGDAAAVDESARDDDDVDGDDGDGPRLPLAAQMDVDAAASATRACNNRRR
jgi:hypothetical protein